MFDNVAIVKIRIVLFYNKFPIEDSWKLVRNGTGRPITLQVCDVAHCLVLYHVIVEHKIIES